MTVDKMCRNCYTIISNCRRRDLNPHGLCSPLISKTSPSTNFGTPTICAREQGSTSVCKLQILPCFLISDSGSPRQPLTSWHCLSPFIKTNSFLPTSFCNTNDNTIFNVLLNNTIYGAETYA